MPNLFGDVPGAGIGVASKFSTEAIPATAGNVSYTYIVPASKTQQLLSGHISLTTDATAADRRVVLKLLDAANNVLADVHAGAVVAASIVGRHHSFMQGVYRETSVINNTLQIPVPKDWVAVAGQKFQVTIEAGVAGDSFSGSFMLKDVA